MRAGALTYLLKGFDPHSFRYASPAGEMETLGLALGINGQQTGVIRIKRCGTSQNLGPSARRRAGWREVRDVEALRRLLDPGDSRLARREALRSVEPDSPGRITHQTGNLRRPDRPSPCNRPRRGSADLTAAAYERRTLCRRENNPKQNACGSGIPPYP
jgi:hypothetical protein